VTIKTIKLGDIAKCKVTGFEGAVIGWTSYLHSCDQFTIQPKGVKDGKPIACRTYDVLQLERVGSGACAVVIPQRVKAPPSLGDKVECALTGAVGIVTSRTIWSNGCVRLGVQPIELKDGAPVDSVSVDEVDAKVIALTMVGREAKRAKTGGPRPEPKR
jgi:hypothetical protein